MYIIELNWFILIDVKSNRCKKTKYFGNKLYILQQVGEEYYGIL